MFISNREHKSKSNLAYHKLVIFKAVLLNACIMLIIIPTITIYFTVNNVRYTFWIQPKQETIIIIIITNLFPQIEIYDIIN